MRARSLLAVVASAFAAGAGADECASVRAERDRLAHETTAAHEAGLDTYPALVRRWENVASEYRRCMTDQRPVYPPGEPEPPPKPRAESPAQGGRTADLWIYVERDKSFDYAGRSDRFNLFTVSVSTAFDTNGRKLAVRIKNSTRSHEVSFFDPIYADEGLVTKDMNNWPGTTLTSITGASAQFSTQGLRCERTSMRLATRVIFACNFR